MASFLNLSVFQTSQMCIDKKRFVTLTTIAVAVLVFASHNASALPVNSIKEIAGSRQELSSFSKRQMGGAGGSGNGADGSDSAIGGGAGIGLNLNLNLGGGISDGFVKHWVQKYQ
ncbi:hypothetical protein K501DRAFT_271969 [Backusella circina FSU 941]|nr:hypothetical protein K501DRAFT_271969 [Backusella circina FSU 941]